MKSANNLLDEYPNYSAIKIRNQLRNEKIDKNQLCNYLIELSKKKNKLYKAFKVLNHKYIEAQFKETKNKKLPLYGIPVGIKDIFNTYDAPNSFGSEIYKSYLPGNDARIVFDIRDKGGIVFGKTYSSEFAVHNPTPTLHPIDKKLSPGTSSAGSAVAVAKKMVPIAIGSQTAGSIIRPASYCGVLGFKPTFGTIARTGVLKTADTLDTIGFFSNYTDDIELIFNSVRQKGRNYPHIKNNFYTKKNNFQKTRIRIAKIKGPKSKNISLNLNKEFDKIVQKLSNFKNIEIVDYNLPKIFDDAHYYHDILYTKSLSYYLRKEYLNNPKKFSKSLKSMILKGQKISNLKYDEAVNYQYNLIDTLENIFNKFDFLIDLSTFTTAQNLEKMEFKIII